MSRARIALALLALLLPAPAEAGPAAPWLSPGFRGSSVAAGAYGEDGHYEVPSDLVMFGEVLELGLTLSPSILLSLGVEHSTALDTDPGRGSGTLAFVGFDVPARARVLGLGSESGRFYVVVGVGYAALWDHSWQYPPGTTEGASLRSAGSMFELGVAYRIRVSASASLEVGLIPRIQFTSASNGAGYLSDATFIQTSVPVCVSLPVSL